MTAKRPTKKAPAKAGADVVAEMRRRVLALKSTPAHGEVFTAYIQSRPWQRDAEDALRRDAPNGLRRLRDHFDDIDQAELARLLVESALMNHRESFACRAPRPTEGMLAVFEAMRADESKVAGTVRRARAGNTDAWDACMHYLDRSSRTRIVGEPPARTVVIDPIPDEVECLMRECLAGYVARPKPRTWEYLEGATLDEVDGLIFAIWAGTESGMSATSRKPGSSVCGIVSEVTGVSEHTVNRLWQSRRHKHRRERG